MARAIWGGVLLPALVPNALATPWQRISPAPETPPGFSVEVRCAFGRDTRHSEPQDGRSVLGILRVSRTPRTAHEATQRRLRPWQDEKLGGLFLARVSLRRWRAESGHADTPVTPVRAVVPTIIMRVGSCFAAWCESVDVFHLGA